DQWSRRSPEEREAWKEADEIAARFAELRAAGPAARMDPGWIDVILRASGKVNERPRIHEPVAPYVRPSTPEARDLTEAEAREALRRDWLHQAGGNPSPERILREIVWARELARRIEARGADVSSERSALERLESEAARLAAADAELYFRVREVKRAVAFRNPVFDFDRVLFVDIPYPQGSEWRHETRHRLGYMAVPGGRLLVLEGLSPGGRVAQLLPQPPLHGSFWRPDLSYDARKVIVSFKAHNEKSFHLWEVGTDGSGARQLTDGPFDDLDPIYLPDERHLVFTTTRVHTNVRCMPPTNAYVLARCDRHGRNVYIISQNNEPDYLPSVLDDGRIIYTRWEYTDKPLWRPQKLWVANPDGTGVVMYWGNQSVWPDLVKDARQIPGSRRVMVTGSAHHDWFSGSVAIVDVSKGLNYPHGLTKVTADVPWPECGSGPEDAVESPRYHASGEYPAYYSPYPLGEEDFLVSALRGGKFLLYWMDVHGNRELVYEGAHNVLHAIPVRPRARPPAIADRVDWPSREARLEPRGGPSSAPTCSRGSRRLSEGRCATSASSTSSPRRTRTGTRGRTSRRVRSSPRCSRTG
ncbi:MAG: TolB family protein, partial [Planctomycetota bacterium]